VDVLKDLELLINSRSPIIAVETYEEERVEEALRAITTKLALPFFVWTVTEGLRRHGSETPLYDTQRPAMALGNLISMRAEGVYLFKGLDRHWGEAEVVRKLQDLARAFAKARRALILSAPQVVPPPELEKLVAVMKLELPTAEELRRLADRVIEDLSRQHRIRIELGAEERERLVDTLRGFTLFEAERVLTRVILDDLALTLKDLDRIIEAKKALFDREGIIEYFPHEEGLAQIGGLGSLKTWLQKRRKAFSREAKQFGVPAPKGILLLGVQGCGKSLAAKAVAKEWGVPLLRMEPGRLYDKYVGESEKRLERALQLAERLAPCVLMVDEIEKGFAYVADAEGDAGLSRRIFGRLLGWLQDRAAPVFVVATCNQIAQLPPELLRKGRFDEIFFLDLPSREERKEIFAVHLAKRKRDPSGFDLDALADASEGFSGAEIEAGVVSALYTAFSQGSELETGLVVRELKGTKPLSVTRAEDVEALRDWARDRTVMAS
jgi:hypothetical protein